MTEQIRYLTPGWRDEAERRLKSELCPERMNFITSSMSNIYLDCPDRCEPLSVFSLTVDEIK